MSKRGKCHFCDTTCLQCTGPESEACTTCRETRLFEDGRCVTHCQAGRFAMGKQCLLCHHTCKACTDEGPDNCTSCGTGIHSHRSRLIRIFESLDSHVSAQKVGSAD
ncbi:hypothetical protein ILYODFUR_024650 [Ilyodon furcidens]|uniref:Uncharacterized protein n=1 Tax=Ilyodon furcidens TaxID=33524 RepID=A0ABV0UIS5_9TELE